MWLSLRPTRKLELFTAVAGEVKNVILRKEGIREEIFVLKVIVQMEDVRVSRRTGQFCRAIKAAVAASFHCFCSSTPGIAGGQRSAPDRLAKRASHLWRLLVVNTAQWRHELGCSTA